MDYTNNMHELNEIQKTELDIEHMILDELEKKRNPGEHSLKDKYEKALKEHAEHEHKKDK